VWRLAPLPCEGDVPEERRQAYVDAYLARLYQGDHPSELQRQANSSVVLETLNTVHAEFHDIGNVDRREQLRWKTACTVEARLLLITAAVCRSGDNTERTRLSYPFLCDT